MNVELFEDDALFKGEFIASLGDPEGCKAGAGEFSLEELSLLTPQNQRDVISRVSSEHNVDALVDGMLTIDPARRLTARGALEKWEAILARRSSLRGRFGPVFEPRAPLPWVSRGSGPEQAVVLDGPSLVVRENYQGESRR